MKKLSGLLCLALMFLFSTLNFANANEDRVIRKLEVPDSLGVSCLAAVKEQHEDEAVRVKLCHCFIDYLANGEHLEVFGMSVADEQNMYKIMETLLQATGSSTNDEVVIQGLMSRYSMPLVSKTAMLFQKSFSGCSFKAIQ